MTGQVRPVAVIMCALCLLLISGCGGSRGVAVKETPVPPGFSATCVAALPVDSAIDYDGNLSYDDARSLTQGVKIANRLLLKHFIDHKDLRFVGDDQLAVLDATGMNQPLIRARAVARHLSCNTVLETTLHRYSDRLGGRYSADVPASVAFEYRLIEVESGTVLCRGKYDETQQSVMDNILTWGKARSRGFTWISAEELLQEGMKEKFGACSYLGDR